MVLILSNIYIIPHQIHSSRDLYDRPGVDDITVLLYLYRRIQNMHNTRLLMYNGTGCVLGGIFMFYTSYCLQTAQKLRCRILLSLFLRQGWLADMSRPHPTVPVYSNIAQAGHTARCFIILRFGFTRIHEIFQHG